MRAAATAAQETEQATEQEGRQETTFVPGADDEAALKTLAKQAGEAAQLLKMLANEKRLLILCFLAVRGEMTVGELVAVVKLSQSALSQHLAKLRADGLVEFRRTSQTLHYRVADPRTLRLLGVLKEIFCGDLK
ncbi:ArsR/SmtB family transcription factor [Bradyrhizobium lablabi]|uniref:ArsR/SmtB family transcription factor n=1 Tax=Bradyrhizobium lablabi TaxID=722472 RepID=UPI0009E9322A|nr:metalloregulator ArsR/SmtB family transcription factor [Bradyrhizobium lablabi]